MAQQGCSADQPRKMICMVLAAVMVAMVLALVNGVMIILHNQSMVYLLVTQRTPHLLGQVMNQTQGRRMRIQSVVSIYHQTE